jgi:hypothetical protein
MANRSEILRRLSNPADGALPKRWELRNTITLGKPVDTEQLRAEIALGVTESRRREWVASVASDPSGYFYFYVHPDTPAQQPLITMHEGHPFIAVAVGSGPHLDVRLSILTRLRGLESFADNVDGEVVFFAASPAVEPSALATFRQYIFSGG